MGSSSSVQRRSRTELVVLYKYTHFWQEMVCPLAKWSLQNCAAETKATQDPFAEWWAEGGKKSRGAPGAASKLCEIFSAVWRAATDPRTGAANIRDTTVRAIAWLLPVHCFLTAACKHYRSTLEFHYLICCTGVTQPGIWALYHIISSTAIFAGLLWERRNALACSKGECEQRHTVKQAVLGASSWRLAWGSAASDLGTESSPAAGVL